MQQMVANIRQTSDNAKLTERMAVESAQDARQGGKAVNETIEAMKAARRGKLTKVGHPDGLLESLNADD